MNINDTQLSVVMLSVAFFAIMLNVFMMSVVMPNVFMLSVVATNEKAAHYSAGSLSLSNTVGATTLRIMTFSITIDKM
jgi:hypothetical protein